MVRRIEYRIEARNRRRLVVLGRNVGFIEPIPPGPDPPPVNWALTFNGRALEIDGVPINQGETAEGIPTNSRMVQATSDFSGEIAQWDADANTEAFVAQLDTYAAHGLNAITVNFQGGLYEPSWQENYLNSAWTSAGGLKQAYADRMTLALDGMVARQIIPIVSLFYFRQDQVLANEAAVIAAVDNATAFLEPWQDQIIIEVINEASHNLVDQPILMEDRAAELVLRCQNAGYFASFSIVPGGVPTTAQAGTADVIFLHGNNRTPTQIRSMAQTAKTRFPGRPVLFNEDGPTGTNTYTPQDYINNLNAAIVDESCGWGYYDQSGFQDNGLSAETIRWELDEPDKNQVFDRFLALAGARSYFPVDELVGATV